MTAFTGNVVSGNWYNADGLPVYFPGHYADAAQRTNKPTGDITFGVTRQIVIPFDLSKLASGSSSLTVDKNNDGTTDAFSEHDPHIPANSSLVSAKLFFTTSAASGTSLIVGLSKIDGTQISTNGLVTATEAVTANMVKGYTIVGQGSLVTPSSGVIGTAVANNAWPTITVTGTFTAGTGFLVVDFIDIAANPEASTNN